ncbi:MAG: HypC/HybG/HupF family hydrogenase formation chaperone [Betaproteobacteria bacterium]
MCLGVPGLVTEVDDLTAIVDFWGVRRRVRLDLVDEPVRVGDYVLNHVGFAIRRIAPEDVGMTLQLYEDLLRESQKDEGDLMTADVLGELEAGRAATPEAESLCSRPRNSEDMARRAGSEPRAATPEAESLRSRPRNSEDVARRAGVGPREQ